MQATIRSAQTSDIEAIASMVKAERFQADGSGALLPVTAAHLRAILRNANRGVFFVADDSSDGIVGCVSVVVYGLPREYAGAITRLRQRLTAGAISLPWAEGRDLGAGLAVITQGEAISTTVAELRSLVVSDKARGRGVGGELIEMAKAEAKARGFAELYSLVNEQVVRLFERSGFTRAVRNPQKLLVDCATCPILEHCNEVPVVARLG